jgi:two-component system response regulator CpxR
LSILLIDDDLELCALLSEILENEGFAVASAHDGPAGLAMAGEGTFDLAIVDVMMPMMDGFDVLRQLRADSELPVIMLTARTASTDRILGLDLGADDYVPKPFEPQELAARIRAILRRARWQEPGRPDIIEVPPVRLDTALRKVWTDGAEVELTSLEFDILAFLMRSAGRVITRAALIEKLHGRHLGFPDRSIDVHISHLRKKLNSAGLLIRAIRGAGYQFCAGRREGADV